MKRMIKNLIANGEGTTLDGWLHTNVTVESNGFKLSEGTMRQNIPVHDATVDVYKLELDVHECIMLSNMQITAIYTDGTFQSFIQVIAEVEHISLLIDIMEQKIAEIKVVIHGSATLSNVALRPHSGFTTAQKKEIEEKIEEQIEEQASGFTEPQMDILTETISKQTVAQTVLDHLPTQEECDLFADGDIVHVYDPNNPYMKSINTVFPITNSFYVKKGAGVEPEPEPIGGDFMFVVGDYWGESFVYTAKVSSRAAVAPNFTIDWGDGTQSIVTNYSDQGQRTHTYPRGEEWTITIKNYVSGIFLFSNDTALIKINSAMPNMGIIDFDGFGYVSFDHVFSGCTNLTSIPGGLLSNNSNIESVGSLFAGCSSLNSIPKNLFSSCHGLSDFQMCFRECTSLKLIPEDLFDNNTDAEVFYQCFYNCYSLEGNAPLLWLRNNPDINGYQCFYNCKKLSNYSDIPSTWK